MNTPVVALDLTEKAPHSPRERIGGFVIASRTVDKCRASLAGMLGEYHYDCPLDSMLFSFKKFTGDNERLVEEGIAGAEHDQMLQATKKNHRKPTKLSEAATKEMEKKEEERTIEPRRCQALERIYRPRPGVNCMKNYGQPTSTHPFLEGVKPEHLAILARHAREVEFMASQVIFRQNENAHQVYLILEGKVVVESCVARADAIPLQIVGAGDELGWSWLFPPFVWHFQARALEPTRAIVIDGAILLAACEQNQTFGFELMQRIAQVVVKRLEAAQQRLLEIQKATGPLPVIDEPQGNGVAGHLIAQSLAGMLAEHPFFTGMKDEHLKILSDAAMKAEFDVGQVIFREGDPANRFYLIQRGKVVLERVGGETPSAQIQIIGDGDVLGWSWLFPPFYSHFEARVLEPTQSIFLYGTRLREACEQNCELGYALMKRIAEVVIKRLSATQQRLTQRI